MRLQKKNTARYPMKKTPSDISRAFARERTLQRKHITTITMDCWIDPKDHLYRVLDVERNWFRSYEMPWYHLGKVLADEKTTKVDAIRIMGSLLMGKDRDELAKALRDPPPPADRNLVAVLPEELLTKILCLLVGDSYFYCQYITVLHLSVVCKTFYRCVWSSTALRARHAEMPMGLNPNRKYRDMFRKKRRTAADKTKDAKLDKLAMVVMESKRMTEFPDMEAFYPDLWEIVAAKESSSLKKAHAWRTFETRRLTWIHAVFLVFYGSSWSHCAKIVSDTLGANDYLSPSIHNLHFRTIAEGPELRCTGCRDFLYLRPESLMNPDQDYVPHMEFGLTDCNVLCLPCYAEFRESDPTTTMKENGIFVKPTTAKRKRATAPSKPRKKARIRAVYLKPKHPPLDLRSSWRRILKHVDDGC